MLVLTRKVGQSLILPGIEIKVLKISGRQVSIGITASTDIPIIREELLSDEQRNHVANDQGAVRSGPHPLPIDPTEGHAE